MADPIKPITPSPKTPLEAEVASQDVTTEASEAPVATVAPPTPKVATTVAKPIIVETPTRSVQVLYDHRCRIGGTDYILKENTRVTLPEEVAVILGNQKIVVIR